MTPPDREFADPGVAEDVHLGGRVPRLQRLEDRQREDEIADGAAADDQDSSHSAHSSGAYFTPSAAGCQAADFFLTRRARGNRMKLSERVGSSIGT